MVDPEIRLRIPSFLVPESFDNLTFQMHKVIGFFAPNPPVDVFQSWGLML